jgi:hypothetical protein
VTTAMLASTDRLALARREFLKLLRTPLGPFPTYPFVEEYFADLVSGDDVICAKSRQMMASWIACAAVLFRMLHKRGYSALVTSRKQQLVDDGGENSTPQSLMGRIRYLCESLPEGFPRVGFAHLRAICPDMGSHVVGEGATVDVGRGGTYDNVLGDEWAFVPQSNRAFSSLRAACKRGIWLPSTANGPEGSFASLWEKSPEGFRKVRLHWTKHPLRYTGELDHVTGRPTSRWYRELCASMTPDQIARELDIDFAVSASGLVFPEFSYDRHMRSDLAYDPDLPLHFGMDFGIGAATAACVFQVHPSDPIKVRILADYEMENAPATVNASNLTSVLHRLGYRGRLQDVFAYGDPAGNAREIATGSTVIREYRTFGFSNFQTRRVKKSDGIRLVRNMLHRGQIAVSTQCELLPKRIADYRYPTDDNGSVKGDEPVKNRATHLCDSLRYGLTGVFPVDGSDLSFSTAPIPKPLEVREVVRSEERIRHRDVARPIASAVVGMEF